MGHGRSVSSQRMDLTSRCTRPGQSRRGAITLRPQPGSCLAAWCEVYRPAGRRSIIGAGATFVGIVAFLGLGQPQGGISQPKDSAWWACGLTIVAIMFLLSGLARRRRGAIAAALFATAAGIGFGFQAAVTKVFVDLIGNGLGVILTSWTTYALIISALAGFALQQSALKTSFLAPAMAASNAASLATSVFLGVILFEETISKGQGRLPPALFALALAIFGVILLAYPQNRLSEDIAK
jgi:hypothetical protein